MVIVNDLRSSTNVWALVWTGGPQVQWSEMNDKKTIIRVVWEVKWKMDCRRIWAIVLQRAYFVLKSVRSYTNKRSRKWRAECSFRKGLDNLGHRVESSQHFFFLLPAHLWDEVYSCWSQELAMLVILSLGVRSLSIQGAARICPYWTNPSSM